jgi:hypothetical protein
MGARALQTRHFRVGVRLPDARPKNLDRKVR